MKLPKFPLKIVEFLIFDGFWESTPFEILCLTLVKQNFQTGGSPTLARDPTDLASPPLQPWTTDMAFSMTNS